MLELCQNDCIVVGLGANLFKDLRQVEGLDVNAVFCMATSSKRTVLNAVVRAPMQPRLKRFMPFTTRQMAAKSRRFSWNFALSGCTTWGLRTVNGTLY